MMKNIDLIYTFTFSSDIGVNFVLFLRKNKCRK